MFIIKKNNNLKSLFCFFSYSYFHIPLLKPVFEKALVNKIEDQDSFILKNDQTICCSYIGTKNLLFDWFDL